MINSNSPYKYSEHQILSTLVGIVYLWFGFLKIFPQLSPAEEIAYQVIDWLTFGLLPKQLAIYILGIGEIGIGIALLFYAKRNIVIKITLAHMFCTFLPLFIFPGESFAYFPYAFSLLGQYIFKNIIIVGILIILLRANTHHQKALN
ncbi:doxx family protein [Tenacibaculum sp. 190524A05c]|uniref:Doxx family protein n=1 Tax=Tenacibaculum platacis TaxID=3137852 RepID=A0ABM9NSW6_9FLAO